MPDKVQHANDNTFPQTAFAVASTTFIGSVAAASFFNSGYGEAFNDFIVKKRFQTEEAKKYFLENNGNVALLNKTGLNDALEKANERYEAVKNTGRTTSYHYSNDAKLKRFVDFVRNNDNGGEKIYRNLYNNEIKTNLLKHIEQTYRQDSVYTTFFKDSLDLIVNNAENGDIDAVLSSFQKRLTKDEFFAKELSIEIADLFKHVNTFKNSMPYNSFKETKEAQNAAKVIIDSTFDVVSMEKKQAEKNATKLARIGKGIMGDTNVTIGQALEWHKNNTEQWQQLKSIFDFDLAKNIETEKTKNTDFNVIEKIVEYADSLKKDDPKLEALKKLELDNILLGKESGKVYTNADMVALGKKGLMSGLMTFPFSILHLQDPLNNGNMPSFHIFNPGDNLPHIASKLESSVGDVLSEPLIFKDGRFYQIKDGRLKTVKGLEDRYKLVRPNIGLENERSKNFYGPYDDPSRMESEIDKALSELGISRTKTVMSAEFGNNAKLFGEFSKENVEKLRDAFEIVSNVDKFENEAIEEAFGTLNGAKRYTNFLKKNTKEFTGDVARKLQDSGLDEKILGFITDLENEEKFTSVIKQIADYENTLDQTVANGRVKQLVEEYLDNPTKALASSVTEKDKYRITEAGQYDIVSFRRRLQRELSEDALYRYSLSENKDYEKLFNIFKERLETGEAGAAKELAAVTEYFSRIGMYDGHKSKYTEEMASIVNGIESFVEGLENKNKNTSIISDTLQNLNSRYSFDEFGQDTRAQTSIQSIPQYRAVKAHRPFDTREIIAHLNNNEKEKAAEAGAKELYSYLSQYVDDPNSLMSTPFDHLMNRFNDLLGGEISLGEISPGVPLFELDGSRLGLKLTGKDAETGGKILKNLIFKRVLPIYLGYKTLDFTDDVSREIFGTGLKEAGLAGLANLELGIKKVTGFLGMDSSLKSFTRDNAIFDYYSGIFGGDIDPEWKTAEEASEFYQHGYNAIRKARYWTFGSTNEFRGSKIQYFEPNSLRLAASNYKDESLYNGSSITKWNPLQIFNRYYLEDLHYNDRPYPVSGGFFDDNTPWGVALNPIISDGFLKPRKMMHRERLYGGQDVKAIIAHVNNQIRQKSMEQNGTKNVFYIQNGKLQSVDYHILNESTNAVGSAENNNNETNEFDIANTNKQIFATITKQPQNTNITLSDGDRLAISAAKGNIVAKLFNSLNHSSLNIIKQANKEIRDKANSNTAPQLPQNGVIAGESKINNRYAAIENFLNDGENIESMLGQSQADYIEQMATTTRLITGLYGYMGNVVTGFGDYNAKHLASSADMTSTSRAFWDSGLGGLGGEPMEAIRRTIPEFRRSSRINPLMNEMPEWIPEKFRFGDPYTALPNGEARMPGRGYESINPLHSDQFGKYGAFDRYKILSDIAPGSAEYNLWKKIASNTVADPRLKKEMEKIQEHVNRQRKEHDFKEYKYVGRGTSERNAYVTKVLANGKFQVTGSDQIYSLAGVKINRNEQESTKDVLNRYIAPGTSVKIVVEDDPYYARTGDTDKSIYAGLMTNGESVSARMIEAGDATKRKDDNSAASAQGGHGWEVNIINYAAELVAHANIPIVHDRWLRVNSALEDYKDQYLYGSSFQDWMHPIDTFVMPALRTYASSGGWMATGIAADIIYNNMHPGMGGSQTLKTFITDVMKHEGIQGAEEIVEKFVNNSKYLKIAGRATMLDRGGLLGSIAGELLNYGAPGMEKYARKYGRRLGNVAALGFAAVAAPENLAVQTLSWSRLAYVASDLMKTGHNKHMAMLGGAIGVARWAGSVKMLATDETANTYIPDKVRERWDMQDYFDRLNYLKYMGLYNKAADKALSEEGVDIRAILEQQDQEAKDIAKTRDEVKQALDDIKKRHDAEANRVRRNLLAKLEELKGASSEAPMTGGDYTKSAIMYFNAAKSTMYAIGKDSSMNDIFRALPKTEREYYLQFMKEKNPKKRKEILSTVSPSLRKALKLVWYGDYETPESNESYFATHALPAPIWGGWNPNIDLEDVKAKVIANEGTMNPSDFGIYASQYRDDKVINAPNIEYNNGGDGFLVSSLKVESILKGYGLINVDVNVTPKKDSTLDVIANVGTIAAYKMTNIFSSDI